MAKRVSNRRAVAGAVRTNRGRRRMTFHGAASPGQAREKRNFHFPERFLFRFVFRKSGSNQRFQLFSKRGFPKRRRGQKKTRKCEVFITRALTGIRPTGRKRTYPPPRLARGETDPVSAVMSSADATSAAGFGNVQFSKEKTCFGGRSSTTQPAILRHGRQAIVRKNGPL